MAVAYRRTDSKARPDRKVGKGMGNMLVQSPRLSRMVTPASMKQMA